MRKRTVVLLFVACGFAAIVIFGWMTIRQGSSARDNPSPLEAYVAKTALAL
jgi:hypothetical protein